MAPAALPIKLHDSINKGHATVLHVALYLAVAAALIARLFHVCRYLVNDLPRNYVCKSVK